MGEEQKSKTNFEHAVLRGYQHNNNNNDNEKETSPMIDKENVSFMCVQNVDNIGLDGNKNGQANEPGGRDGCAWAWAWASAHGERYVKIELMREYFRSMLYHA